MNLKDAMKMAMQVQDACNLSGVLHSWAEAQSAVRSDTRWSFRRHPVNVLFASKVASLLEVNVTSIGSVTNVEDADLFRSAWDACERESA